MSRLYLGHKFRRGRHDNEVVVLSGEAEGGGAGEGFIWRGSTVLLK